MNSVTLRLIPMFLLALVLTIVPLPEILAGIRLPWVLLLFLYIQFYLPDYFKVSILFIIGLFLDVLLSTVIGEHTLALSLVTWLASNKSRRFYFFSIGQQMILIGFFCLLYQLIILTIDAFLGFYVGIAGAIGSSLMSILVWPWIRLAGGELLLSRLLPRCQ